MVKRTKSKRMQIQKRNKIVKSKSRRNIKIKGKSKKSQTFRKITKSTNNKKHKTHKRIMCGGKDKHSEPKILIGFRDTLTTLLENKSEEQKQKELGEIINKLRTYMYLENRDKKEMLKLEGVEIVDNKALGELVKKHNLIMHDFVDSTEIEINKKIEFLSEIITQAITKKPLDALIIFIML
jgi:hypothetical protein